MRLLHLMNVKCFSSSILSARPICSYFILFFASVRGGKVYILSNQKIIKGIEKIFIISNENRKIVPTDRQERRQNSKCRWPHLRHDCVCCIFSSSNSAKCHPLICECNTHKMKLKYEQNERYPKNSLSLDFLRRRNRTDQKENGRLAAS